MRVTESERERGEEDNFVRRRAEPRQVGAGVTKTKLRKPGGGKFLPARS